MADVADDLLFDGDIFVYRGGRVPEHLRERITRVRIDKSVKIIDEDTFSYFTNLLDVETHDGITKIEECAFSHCRSLRGIKLPGVREIEWGAFQDCCDLTDVEFGEELERIDSWAFNSCRSLRRIAMPLKDDIEFVLEDDAFDRQTQFDGCHNLATVDLVGGIHETISSLHLESWRDEMKEEIGRINRGLLRTASRSKVAAMNRWIQSVIVESNTTNRNTTPC